MDLVTIEKSIADLGKKVRNIYDILFY
jgi:hypothetical protein